MGLARAVIFLTVFLSASHSFAAQPSVEAMYQDARRHYYALFGSPEKMKNRRQWLRVVNKFSIVTKTRPGAKRAADAEYTIGLLYKNLYIRMGRPQDKQEAIFSFRRVVKNYPKSTLVDDAERHIGDIRFRDSEYSKAAMRYRAVATRRKAREAPPRSPPAGVAKGQTGSSNDFTELTEVRRYSRAGYTRMVLYLSRRTAYRAERLTLPDRVFIDLLGATPGASVRKAMKYRSGMVRSVRMGHNRASVTRVVFDLGANAYYSVTSLSDPFRIVIDFGKQRAVARAHKPQAREPAKRPRFESRRPTASSGAIRTIVIDAGHGGKDPGAIGPSGLKEKHVTLALARKLKTILERKMSAKVYLTRSRDRFMELDDRTVLANSLGADLFISLHTNASPNRRARGYETYFLSPARSEDELATAARENMRALGSANAEQNDLAYIMTDMANTQKINDSYTLASAVQRSMVKGMRRSYHGVQNKGVKQAMFYVLWRATMPSILVESGFISNRNEERRLRDPSFQAQLADSIAEGIISYTRTYQLAQR